MNNGNQLLQSLTKKEFEEHEKNVFNTRIKNKKQLDLSLPTKQEIEESTERTRSALQKIIESKLLTKSTTGHLSNTKNDDVYVKYTPNSISNNNQNQRIIKIVEKEVDPMLPPKFKNNKKTPGLSDDLLNNTAVLKQTDQESKPITAEERKSWFIPPAVSNWKNPNGFAIAIDKRLAAFDNKNKHKDSKINDKFIELTQSLNKADEKARIEIKARNKLKLQIAEQKKKENEEKLKELAQESKQNRFNNKRRYFNDNNSKQRELDRKERLLNYERQLKQTKSGLINPISSNSNLENKEGNNDTLFDANVFSKSNRFVKSSEDQLYDTPLFNRHEAIQNIYNVKSQDNDNNDGTYNRVKALGGGEKLQDREGAVRFVKSSEIDKEDEEEESVKRQKI